MTVNTFFVLVVLLLAGIFFIFKPMSVKSEEKMEVAQIDLVNFTTFELDENGLRNVMSGTHGWRYTNRYEILDINFTDKTKDYLQKMSADFGNYQDDVVSLVGDVRYKREDGLAFMSNEATYEQKRSTASTEGEFKIIQNGDWVEGRALVYNSAAGTVNAKEIRANYVIREKGQQ